MKQQTPAGSFTLEGVGIHTGAPCRVTVNPAEAYAGRIFRVAGTDIPARADFVVDTSRCTVLGKDGARVSTVEHLLSALYAFDVDNALIEVEGPEIPILDGSAQPFTEAIRSVGVREQEAPPSVLTLPSLSGKGGGLGRPLEVEDGNSRMTVTPGREFMAQVVTEFADWPEGRAAMTIPCGETFADGYVRRIAPARTFAFRREVEALLAAGLAKGGSLQNALIIDPPDGFSSPLRVPYEWCAHKILDVIGDLALVGARLNIELTAVRPGHRINTRLARALLEHLQTQEDYSVARQEKGDPE